jgi:hypothetical protein
LLKTEMEEDWRGLHTYIVLPVTTYGCETWMLNSRILLKIQCTQRSMQRYMFGITRRDRKRNTWVRSMTKVTDIVERVKNLKWQWPGHIEILEWYLRGCARKLGRPSGRWADELRIMCGVKWMQIAEDRQE